LPHAPSPSTPLPPPNTTPTINIVDAAFPTSPHRDHTIAAAAYSPHHPAATAAATTTTNTTTTIHHLYHPHLVSTSTERHCHNHHHSHSTAAVPPPLSYTIRGVCFGSAAIKGCSMFLFSVRSHKGVPFGSVYCSHHHGCVWFSFTAPRVRLVLGLATKKGVWFRLAAESAFGCGCGSSRSVWVRLILVATVRLRLVMVIQPPLR
nr:hypothetical protein [Tanacetum cinerariifolium]